MPYAGFAIVTKVRTSIGGPRLADGAIQSYDLRPVGGIASEIETFAWSFANGGRG
ncbi:MAG: hypothetical protein ACJ74O_00755 [Frankiaceae bacterium]